MDKKILIVDDNEDFVTYLQYRLESRGYEVESCGHGGEAQDKMADNDYGLLLLDYFLPGIKGDEICEGIRQDDRLKRLPVILMTGFADYAEDFFTQKGATDVLYKPFEIEELFKKIDTLLPAGSDQAIVS